MYNLFSSSIIAPTYWLFFNADNIDEGDDVNSNNCDNDNYDMLATLIMILILICS